MRRRAKRVGIIIKIFGAIEKHEFDKDVFQMLKKNTTKCLSFLRRQESTPVKAWIPDTVA